MIRRAVEWFAGVFLWPFQALFMRWDSYSVLHDWAGAVAGDEEDLPDYYRGPAAMDEF